MSQTCAATAPTALQASDVNKNKSDWSPTRGAAVCVDGVSAPLASRSRRIIESRRAEGRLAQSKRRCIIAVVWGVVKGSASCWLRKSSKASKVEPTGSGKVATSSSSAWKALLKASNGTAMVSCQKNTIRLKVAKTMHAEVNSMVVSSRNAAGPSDELLISCLGNRLSSSLRATDLQPTCSLPAAYLQPTCSLPAAYLHVKTPTQAVG